MTYDISSSLQLRSSAVSTPKLVLNELLAELVEEVKDLEVRARGDLDQLGEAISHLSDREGSQECEVQEGVHGGVVGAKAVLVVAVVDGDLDGDTGVDEANDGGGNSDEVRVSAIRRASKAMRE